MFGIDLFSKILILDAILVFQFYALLHVIFALVVCILYLYYDKLFQVFVESLVPSDHTS